jgi:uncharacterized membrane protein YedE/YeeE
MEIVNFTPGMALAGGALIGVASSLFLLTTGRVAGISGVVGGVVCPTRGDVLWRVAFVVGLVLVGAVAVVVVPERVDYDVSRSIGLMVVAGLLVGFGTRLGSGCTSGHGVCGLSRLSLRSLVSTLTFIAAGVVTVALMRQLAGGVS